VKRGKWMVCREKEPIVSIYRVEGWPRGAGKVDHGLDVSGDRRGKLWSAAGRRRLGGASALDGASNDGLWRAGDGGVLAVPWRTVLIMAVATVQGQAWGFV
jgi:hypothetical protein